MKSKKDHPFLGTNMPLSMRVFLALVGFSLKVISVFSPKLAGKLALDLFLRPPPVVSPRREQAIRERATVSYRTIHGRQYAVFVWEPEATNRKDDKPPTILLSHGWAGRTTQFFAIIERLLTAGYRVVGADLPAHGVSEGKRTNMLEGTVILSKMAEDFGPLSAIIGHSFGTGTTLLALDRYGVRAPKIALLAGYSRVSFIIDLFSSTFGLNERTREQMLSIGYARFSKQYNTAWDWEDISPVNTLPSYQGRVFIAHDTEDHEVPIEHAAELHKVHASAEVLITTGLGHRRILRNAEVIDQLMAFLQAD